MSFGRNSEASAASLDELWPKRDDWKKEAIRRLLGGAEPGTRKRSDERFAVVFGLPQVGKTELILRLIGVDPKHLSEIYRLIRGGAKDGNSSTSHAIVYRQGAGRQFEVWHQSSLAGQPFDKQTLDGAGVSQYIDDLRERINKDKFTRDLIYIAIPRRFCSEGSARDCDLNVIDLPGKDSKDRREQEYAAHLYEQYARLAAVTIVVGEANQINSLPKLEVPGQDGHWWLNAGKTLLVITKFYSTIPESDESDAFRAYVAEDSAPCFCKKAVERCREKLEREVFHPVGGEFPLEVFPIDLGESLEQYKRSLRDDKARERMEEATALICKSIRESVAKRENGENYFMFVKDYRRRLEEERNERQAAYQKRLRELNEGMGKNEKDRETAESKLGDRQDDFQRAHRATEDFNSRTFEPGPCPLHIFNIDSKYFGAFSSKLKLSSALDFAGTAWESAREYLEVQLEDSVLGGIDEQQQAELFEEFERIVDTFGSRLETRFREGWFRGPSKDDCIRHIRFAWSELEDEMSCAYSKYQSSVGGLLEERERQASGAIKRLENAVKIISEKQSAMSAEKEELEKEQKGKEKIFEDNIRRCDRAEDTARDCFEHQRGEIVKRLNHAAGPAEKMKYLLLLAGMEQEFNSMFLE